MEKKTEYVTKTDAKTLEGRIAEYQARLEANTENQEAARQRVVNGDEVAFDDLLRLALIPRVLPGVIQELKKQLRDLARPQQSGATIEV